MIKPTERLIEPAESRVRLFIVGRSRTGQRRPLGALRQGQRWSCTVPAGIGAAAEATEDAPEPGVGALTGTAWPGPAACFPGLWRPWYGVLTVAHPLPTG
ncbi:hypothetical protein SAMN04489764_4110 [Thermostaphylospora chromogena]|uniref:Uncharacterized protein n=1 Tax=Thermostaphylospora chromogena TaxID=35622 RepID=A0A1H1H6S6_9ACTN|nr:hypothetical protein SAMN04489764_4110 [Thermostaphylospora chromogena]